MAKDVKIVIEKISLCSVNEPFNISLVLSIRPLSSLSYPLVLFQGMHLLSKAVRRSVMASHLTLTTCEVRELFRTSIMSPHQLAMLVGTLRRYVYLSLK